MNSQDLYSMVQECTDRYEAQRSDTGDLEISIRVPRRFADLWLVKLSGLRTSGSEIAEYAPKPDEGEDSEGT